MKRTDKVIFVLVLLVSFKRNARRHGQQLKAIHSLVFEFSPKILLLPVLGTTM